MKTDYRPLSIYVHIPFCARKCLYCDFLSAPAEIDIQESYLKCLIEEIRQDARNFGDYEVQTVFIGGGTPSLVSEEWILAVMQEIYVNYRMSKQPEITIEVNPGTVTQRKLTSYRNAGINRLSIGLQSANDEELKLLGRIHTSKDFFGTYDYAVKSGFNNINIDLMTAIPGQTEESYRETLGKILSLNPKPRHISAYSLIIEEGTPFFENTPELPDEETDRLLYKITNDILKENGYHRYEISNYALEGYECRHNKVYWKRGEYVGFGIGAASLVNNTRFSTIRDRNSYIDRIFHLSGAEENACRTWNTHDIKENYEKLSKKEQMEEYMFLGLRLTEGVSCREFERLFDRKIDEIYPGVVQKMERQGLLLCKYDENGIKERLYLSELGLDVSNMVMAEFLLT